MPNAFFYFAVVIDRRVIHILLTSMNVSKCNLASHGLLTSMNVSKCNLASHGLFAFLEVPSNCKNSKAHFSMILMC